MESAAASEVQELSAEDLEILEELAEEDLPDEGPSLHQCEAYPEWGVPNQERYWEYDSEEEYAGQVAMVTPHNFDWVEKEEKARVCTSAHSHTGTPYEELSMTHPSKEAECNLVGIATALNLMEEETSPEATPSEEEEAGIEASGPPRRSPRVVSAPQKAAPTNPPAPDPAAEDSEDLLEESPDPGPTPNKPSRMKKINHYPQPADRVIDLDVREVAKKRLDYKLVGMRRALKTPTSVSTSGSWFGS